MRKFIVLMVSLCLAWTLLSSTVFAAKGSYSGATHSLKTSFFLWKYERLSVQNNEGWAMTMTATVKIYGKDGYIDGNSVSKYVITNGNTKKLDSPSSTGVTSGKYNYLLTTNVGGSWSSSGTDN